MKKLSMFVASVAIVMAAGCTKYEDHVAVDSVRTMEPTMGTEFTKALAKEYATYAVFEAEKEYEWHHAAGFANKSQGAAKGEMVMPEKVADWEVPAGRVGTLDGSRAKLLSLLDAGARERVPEHAAKAQVMFDCWVEEEAEGDETSQCKAVFEKILPLLEGQAKIVKTFIVYFDFNKADITPAAAKTLDEVATEQGIIKPTQVFLSGHTDTVGNSGYNEQLSNRRAQAVAAELALRGVASKMLDLKHYGEANLAVSTGDNVQEGKNRRVEIYFEK